MEISCCGSKIMQNILTDLHIHDIRVCNWKIYFLFLNRIICCGYSKEQSKCDGSFEKPKHMFTLIDKDNILSKLLFNCSYAFKMALVYLKNWAIA